jgi:hypothetical protein
MPDGTGAWNGLSTRLSTNWIERRKVVDKSRESALAVQKFRLGCGRLRSEHSQARRPVGQAMQARRARR